MRKAVVIALVMLAAATPVWAHVSVAPQQAAKGATVSFTFAVPNEDRLHATVAVEIVWPEDVLLTEITPEPKAGWTFTPSERSAKWSGGAIRGDLKESFVVALGPLPNSATIAFKAIQTYDNGTVVRWIGEESSDNPAPVVALTGEPVEAVTTTLATLPPTTTARLVADKTDTNVAPLVFGALVLTGIGIGIAIGARRRAGPPSP